MRRDQDTLGLNCEIDVSSQKTVMGSYCVCSAADFTKLPHNHKMGGEKQPIKEEIVPISEQLWRLACRFMHRADYPNNIEYLSTTH